MSNLSHCQKAQSQGPSGLQKDNCKIMEKGRVALLTWRKNNFDSIIKVLTKNQEIVIMRQLVKAKRP